MGMFDFVANAGKKLFGKDDAPELRADALKQHLLDNGVEAEGIFFMIDADNSVKLMGTVPDQANREKAVICCGNVEGVEKVEDRLRIAEQPVASVEEAEVLVASADEAPWSSRTYTVEKGDTLWKISTEMYGNGAKYTEIFEANKPMLSDPDKIYPGQVLRIPNLEESMNA